jgi:tetratricopeptide (TPR) repeat protein
MLSAFQQNPKDEHRIALLTQLYLDTGRYTNAFQSVQKQLEIAPDNPRALFLKGVLQMQFGEFAKAIETLNRVVQLQPKNFDALLNRAIANLQSGKLDAAKLDYETMRDSLPKGKVYPIYFRLAEVEEKRNSKSAAIKNYRLYLKHAPHNATDRAEAEKRIAKLEGGKS